MTGFEMIKSMTQDELACFMAEVSLSCRGSNRCFSNCKNELNAYGTCDLCQKAADRLEQAAPPCKIGDEVWCVRKYNKDARRVARGFVRAMYYGDDMRLCICVKGGPVGQWGVDIFDTIEEAEAALLRMTGKE